MSNIFYFDEVGAFGNGIPTPQSGQDINIPQNTIIKITKYIISKNSYRTLSIPENSKLVFESQNTTLYVQNSIISGEVITNVNSEIIEADISGNVDDYTYWHNTSSWNNSLIPGENDDIKIPFKSKIVITNASNLQNNIKFGKLSIPKESELIIDVRNLNIIVSMMSMVKGSVRFSSGSSIRVFHIENLPQYNRNIVTWEQFYASSGFPNQGDDINIPDNTELIIDSSENFYYDVNYYNEINIPESSKFVIDLPGYIFSFVTINDNGLIHVKRGEMAFTTFTGMEFTDASRWANGKIPITGDDIIIPENTIIILNDISIFPNEINYFNNLILPSTSILVMDIPNKQLAFKSMSIDGEIQIKTNSLYPIIHGTTIERWSDDPSIWENNKIPEEGEDISVPENTTIVITNQSNITAKYFKKLSVPSTSKFVIDIPNYTFNAEKLQIAGTIQLNQGSALKIIPPVFTYVVKINMNFVFSGEIRNKLLETSIDNQRKVVTKMIAKFHKIPEDRIKLKNFTIASINADYELLTNNSSDTYLYSFQTTDSSNNLNDLGDSLVDSMNEVFPEEETNFVNQDLGDATSFSAIPQTTANEFTSQSIPPTNIWTTYPNNKYYKTYYFDDVNAWDNNKVPEAGEDIIVPQNTIIQITQFSILATRYKKLIIPINSRVIFINDYINLYIEGVDIRGSIQTSNFSNIIINKNKSLSEVYYNWNDTNAWNGSPPPKPGEHIVIPPNKKIVVTFESNISIVGYKKLEIPESSSLIFDLAYFQFFIQAMSIKGEIKLGEGNRISLNDYYSLTRTYLPVYLDSQGKVQQSQQDASSSLVSTYNFTLSAINTRAIDIAKYIKYRTVNGIPTFIYEEKQYNKLSVALYNDLLLSNLSHVEGKFISNNNTSSGTLSNLYIQYVADVLVRNPTSTDLIKNPSGITNQIINSNLHKQILNTLKQNLDIRTFGTNTIVQSMYNQIKEEKPNRLWNRPDINILYFPIYAGDDISLFVKMRSNVTIPTYEDYNTLKGAYNTAQNSQYLEFNDGNMTMKVKDVIWRIFLNLA